MPKNSLDEVVDLRVVGVGGAEGAEDGVRLLGVAIMRVVGHEHDQLAHKRTEQLGDDIRSTSSQGNMPLMAWASVMAGLMCAPEMPRT